MGAREAWLHWREQCAEELADAEKELAEYEAGLRISQWKAGETPTDTTALHAAECRRRIALYTGILKRIDEDYLGQAG